MPGRGRPPRPGLLRPGRVFSVTCSSVSACSPLAGICRDWPSPVQDGSGVPPGPTLPGAGCSRRSAPPSLNVENASTGLEGEMGLCGLDDSGGRLACRTFRCPWSTRSPTPTRRTTKITTIRFLAAPLRDMMDRRPLPVEEPDYPVSSVRTVSPKTSSSSSPSSTTSNRPAGGTDPRHLTEPDIRPFPASS